MKRVAPILIALFALAGAKKKAMSGHHGTREDRRRQFEERARAWHLKEHETMAEATV